jgi:dethiobiotin synthetase
MPRNNTPIFITATDTHVGKTVTTGVLGLLLQQQGINVGVMKPVQCAGNDAQFLKTLLNINDDLSLINPVFAPEPLSPHQALRRAHKKFELKKVAQALNKLQKVHEQILIEGAGGLMVPLKDGYYNADLIRDLKAHVVIVSRLGLGTINHTLLTINQAKAYGLTIKGIIFCDTNSGAKSLPERTNSQEIARLSKIKVLGTIPYLKPLTRQNILRRCKHLDLPI